MATFTFSTLANNQTLTFNPLVDVLIFDGGDEDAVAAARLQWKTVKEQGLAATYWQPDEQGRWVKKA